MTHKAKFDLPFKALVAAVALAFSIEIHELVHLLTARSLGIPSRFLNFKAVGIPPADVLKYPPGQLAVHNFGSIFAREEQATLFEWT